MTPRGLAFGIDEIRTGRAVFGLLNRGDGPSERSPSSTRSVNQSTAGKARGRTASDARRSPTHVDYAPPTVTTMSVAKPATRPTSTPQYWSSLWPIRCATFSSCMTTYRIEPAASVRNTVLTASLVN